MSARRPSICVCLLALTTAACQSHAPGGAGTTPTAPREAVVRGEAIEASVANPKVTGVLDATQTGDYERAHELLGEMIIGDCIARAQALLAAGDPREALMPLDRALELDSRNGEALFLRGRASYETARVASQPGFFYQDASTSFEAAFLNGYGAEALFAASRAARRVPDPERALELARRGARRVEAMQERPTLAEPIERTWAQAAFDVYLERKRAELDTSESFAETEDQFQKLLGRTPEDPWVYTQLADLYGWEERKDESLAMLESALALAPEEETLHNRVVLLMRELDGREAVIEFYGRFQQDHPGVALGHWYSGMDRFYFALEEYEAGANPCADFQEAEAEFARCRELESVYEQACRGWEVMAHTALGWCLLRSEDLQGAKEAFLSIEDLLEGGPAMTLLDRDGEGNFYDRLQSGLAGLSFVTAGYLERSDNTGRMDGDRESLLNAAAIADYLHAYQPDDADTANNAGFLNRDAAVALERASRVSRHAAAQETDLQKKGELESDADRKLVRAQELMERSYAAYQRAAELAPDDVRIVNDAGLVMAYYLRDDVEAAARYFHQAIAAGELQLEGLEITGETDVQEAFGDAHQNLGVIYLTSKNNPATAKEWFQKSVALGPPTRAWIGERIVPMCERLANGGELSEDDRELLDGMVWLHNPK